MADDATIIYNGSGTSGSFVVETFGTRSTRPKHFLVQPDTDVRFSGGCGARKNHSADGVQVLYPDLPNGNPAIISHTFEASAVSPVTLAAGEWVAIMSPKANSNLQKHQDAVLVEAWDETTPAPLATASDVLGATQADVDAFLNNTPYWHETKGGHWTGRFGRAAANQGDQGYGGWQAMHTALGCLLLSTDISQANKDAVQQRLFLMARDMNKWGSIRYPADGGHGGGWWALMKLGNALGLTIPIEDGVEAPPSPFRYSEIEQAYDRPDPPSNIANYPDPDFRFSRINETNWDGDALPPTKPRAEKYRFCCTVNRWAGAFLSLNKVPAITMTADELRVVDLCKWYLGITRQWVSDPVNQWLFQSMSESALLIDANMAALGIDA